MPPPSSALLQNIPRKLRAASAPGVFFGEVVYAPGGTCGPRVQADFQLVLVRRGEATTSVDDNEVHVPAGAVGLFQPGHRELFRFAENRRTHHSWCSFAPAHVPADLAQRCAATVPVQPISDRLAQLIELGLGLGRTFRPHPGPLAVALGRAALEEYVFAAGRSTAAAAEDPPDALARALDWIGQQGAEPIDLPSLARIAGVSPAQLVKLFRRHLGTTPIRHVWETRTQRGVALLCETGLSVAEVAHRCGFQTPFHFSRWVREVGGRSPRELRAAAWGKRPLTSSVTPRKQTGNVSVTGAGAR
jgi:AraC-like DNA-binding protein